MRLPVINRSIAMLALALAAGLCAAWAARQYIQGRIRQIEARSKVPTAGRVVAAYDLPAGTRLGPEHIAIRQFPAGLVSSDSLAPERFTELTGTVLSTALRAGDPILPAHTVQSRDSPFSSRLTQGRRAITIPIDAINSVSGLLEPGDLIDLYVSFEYRRRHITAPLLQGVLVLATGTATQYAGSRGSAQSGSYSTVTLDTAPEDAIKLVAARQSGTLTALLRHPRDNQPDQKAVRGDLATLLGVNSVAPPSVAQKIPVIYGNQGTRRLPGLRAAPAAPVQAGVFDLPYIPELVSAWKQAANAAESAGQAPALFESSDQP